MKSVNKIAVITLVVFVAVVFLTPSYAMGQFLFMGHPLEGKKAPGFSLSDLQGNEKTLDQLREGKAAILFFWATWCPHCRSQLPYLYSQRVPMQDKGIQFILINIEETASAVNNYFQRANIDFPVFLDEKGEVSADYSILGVPSYFFIDANGIVRAVKHELPSNYEMLLKEGSGEE